MVNVSAEEWNVRQTSAQTQKLICRVGVADRDTNHPLADVSAFDLDDDVDHERQQRPTYLDSGPSPATVCCGAGVQAVGSATVPYSSDLDRLLTVGSSYEKEGVLYLLDVHQLDDVVLPTGRVVGCDPFSIFEGTAAFGTTVPRGTYPMRAWVATVQGGNVERQQRVAALQLVIADEPTERWEMALTKDQDLASLAEDEFYGYPVDGGTGTLADLVAVQALSAWGWDRIVDTFFPGSRPQVPRLLSAARAVPPSMPSPVPGTHTVVADEGTGANIVAVESGWGDGAYPTFVGYSHYEQVTCFVTDFLVVPRQTTN